LVIIERIYLQIIILRVYLKTIDSADNNIVGYLKTIDSADNNIAGLFKDH